MKLTALSTPRVLILIISLQFIAGCQHENETESSKPIAIAGPDLSVSRNTLAIVNGSQSYAQNGEQLSYSWSIEKAPTDSHTDILQTEDGKLEFSADKSGEYVIALAVNDGVEDSEADFVTIIVANEAPVAVAGNNRTSFRNETVFLDGSQSSDPDDDEITYHWKLESKPLNSEFILVDNTVPRPNFQPDVIGTFEFSLIVSDGDKDSTPDRIIVTATNQIPIANAGADIVGLRNESITLDASASLDLDNDELTYFWKLVESPQGSEVSLNNYQSVKPEFQAVLPGQYIFSVVAKDGFTQSEEARVKVTIENRRPKANAGPDTHTFRNAEIILNSLSSYDPDGDKLEFHWEFESIPQGSAATLARVTENVVKFIGDLPGEYHLNLRVNDGITDSDVDQVVILVENRTPIANAGPDKTYFRNTEVSLNSIGSKDLDGDEIQYYWSFKSIPTNSIAKLSGTNTNTVNFIGDMPGQYFLELVVNDGVENSVTDEVIVTVTNRTPIADAGIDRVGYKNSTIELDGSNSYDADNDILKYYWKIDSKPDNSTPLLSEENSKKANLTAKQSGSYTLSLVVNDGDKNSFVDQVHVTVENRTPIANAGNDQQHNRNSTVPLNGLGSTDADNDELQYEWSFQQAPVNSLTNLQNSLTASPSFIADQPGEYIITLSVSDGEITSEADTVTVSVKNRKPVAVSQNLSNITQNSAIVLDGSNSYDPDNDDLSYLWSISSAPQGSSAVLVDKDTASPTIQVDLIGSYLFTLIVDDGITSSDPIEISVSVDTIILYENDFSQNTINDFVVTQLGTANVSIVDGALKISPGADYTNRGNAALHMPSINTAYKTVLSENTGTLEISFNLYNKDSTICGGCNNLFFLSLYSQPDMSESTAFGYALRGGGYVGDRMTFSRFAVALSPFGPLYTIMTDTTSGLSTLPSIGAFRIVYHPTTHTWELYFEQSVETIDPENITTLIGSSTNSGFVNEILPYIVFGSHGGDSAYLDNLKIKLRVTP